jgi:tRNA threonylcarbamoyladenosine biosynthesis protein TsaE
MDTFISNSPEDTQSLGRRWAAELPPGTVIGLSGDLGAGKTQLVKGLAAGLGVTERISSPTFGLVNEYETGRIPLFHLDLYRLDTPEQIRAAGLETYLFNPTGITVVEWIDRWLEASGDQAGFSKRFRHVWIESTTETERRIRHEDSGH